MQKRADGPTKRANAKPGLTTTWSEQAMAFDTLSAAPAAANPVRPGASRTASTIEHAFKAMLAHAMDTDQTAFTAAKSQMAIALAGAFA